MKIDFTDETPRYQQLVNILTRMMKDGQFKVGEQIPSENELVEKLQVSRTTVRQALEELVQAGLLEKRKGQGTFYLGENGKRTSERSHLIGVIMPSLTFTIYPQIIQGVEEVAHQFNYNVIFGNTNANEDKEIRLLEQIAERGVEGLIIEVTRSAELTEQDKVYRMLKNLSVPLVLVDNPIEGISSSYVINDDRAGGVMAAEYLVQRGHKRIALVIKEDVRAGRERRDGCLEALSKCGIKPRPEYLQAYTERDEPDNPSRQLTRKLLSLPEPPTAIFYFNDETALIGIQTIKEKGLVVPADISVIGFDDSPMAAAGEVPLTSLSHPKFFMGKWAADILFEEITARDPVIRHRLCVKPSLVTRNSVSSPR
jgi:GntR family transcriptional regulator of arabinose operon